MPTPPVSLDPTNSSLRAPHSEGYSVVADVGGSGTACLTILAMNPPQAPTGTSTLPEASLRGRDDRMHVERIPVEPCSHELVVSMALRSMGEGGSGSHEGAGLDTSHNTGRGEADGWDVESNLEGTTLPPYAP